MNLNLLTHTLFTLFTYFTSFCTKWYECEVGVRSPYFFTERRNANRLLPHHHSQMEGKSSPQNLRKDPNHLVMTKLGAVQGFPMELVANRKISAFTGIPYGEQPGRFMDPKMRRPWKGKGVWQATSPSPVCHQRWPSGLSVEGQEDCLYLDIYTPQLPVNESSNLFPVIIWLPAGGNLFGRARFWGPSPLLREDVLFVPINTRLGVYGFLSTGDEASAGNWALKDQSLAIEWVHSNIKAFGGDPERIVIGGVSSGGMYAHLMLFSNHTSRNYIKGIIAISGTAMSKVALDGDYGSNQVASNQVARRVGCPTSSTGRRSSDSQRMVDCLRAVDPNVLTNHGITFPLWKAVVEPPHPTAFLTELPEAQYAKGLVPKIPLIATRNDREISVFLGRSLPLLNMPFVLPVALPLMLQSGLRNSLPKPSLVETLLNLRTVYSFYFGRKSVFPPGIWSRRRFYQLVDMFDDMYYFTSLWKSVELHHKVAPTYVYIYNHSSFPFSGKKLGDFWKYGPTHMSDVPMFFNNSKLSANLIPGSKLDRVSARLTNFIANFAATGTPYFRTPQGYLDDELWKPVSDMKNPIALQVGLVNDIKMIRDSWVGSARQRLWETVTF